MIRLIPSSVKKIERAPAVTFTFDGVTVTGHAGESLVAALMRAGYFTLRRAPHDDAPRGAFCGMGLCQECAVRINGTVTEACRTEVAAGLCVTCL